MEEVDRLRQTQELIDGMIEREEFNEALALLYAERVMMQAQIAALGSEVWSGDHSADSIADLYGEIVEAEDYVRELEALVIKIQTTERPAPAQPERRLIGLVPEDLDELLATLALFKQIQDQEDPRAKKLAALKELYRHKLGLVAELEALLQAATDIESISVYTHRLGVAKRDVRLVSDEVRTLEGVMSQVGLRKPFVAPLFQVQLNQARASAESNLELKKLEKLLAERQAQLSAMQFLASLDTESKRAKAVKARHKSADKETIRSKKAELKAARDKALDQIPLLEIDIKNLNQKIALYKGKKD